MTDQVTKSIIVKGELSEIYETWANFENFPRFMKYIQSVEPTGDDTSHWVMQGPLDTTMEWDGKVTRMEENQRIAWKSTEGDLTTSGQVTFKALPQDGVEVTVTLSYVPPAGIAGQALTSLFGDPEGRLIEDLRNFKAYVEGMQERLPPAR